MISSKDIRLHGKSCTHTRIENNPLTIYKSHIPQVAKWCRTKDLFCICIHPFAPATRPTQYLPFVNQRLFPQGQFRRLRLPVPSLNHGLQGKSGFGRARRWRSKRVSFIVEEGLLLKLLRRWVSEWITCLKWWRPREVGPQNRYRSWYNVTYDMK